MDETSPQTTANTVRVWSFTKPKMVKNTNKYKTNGFGFYSINGNSIIDFKEDSKKEKVCEFLEQVKARNSNKDIIIILDNFKSHHANLVTAKANSLNILLIYLPPYSPDLDPIEFIWREIKRAISVTVIKSEEHLKELIYSEFDKNSRSLSYAKSWIEKFLVDNLKV